MGLAFALQFGFDVSNRTVAPYQHAAANGNDGTSYAAVSTGPGENGGDGGDGSVGLPGHNAPKAGSIFVNAALVALKKGEGARPQPPRACSVTHLQPGQVLSLTAAGAQGGTGENAGNGGNGGVGSAGGGSAGDRGGNGGSGGDGGQGGEGGKGGDGGVVSVFSALPVAAGGFRQSRCVTQVAQDASRPTSKPAQVELEAKEAAEAPP